ncbi:MFS transporter [Paenibacillus nicotianae]|uniref:MFS transporter n=1 Tax=Paenibacillus nicotianae TaxID=1526551 RepID=A0ABW4UTM8_9BACL
MVSIANASTDHPNQAKKRQRNIFVFVCLWLLIFLVEFVKGGLLVTLLPVYMGHVLGLPAFAIGIAFALQYVGDNALRGPAGWLAERLGFRMIMSIGMILVLGAVFIMATEKSTGWLILACGVMGIGSAPLWPCVMSKITDLSHADGKYGTSMSIIEIASLGGAGLGPVTVNWISDTSYQSTLWMMLICMTVVLAIALCLPGRKESSSIATVNNHVTDQTHNNAESLTENQLSAPNLSVSRITRKQRLQQYIVLIRSLHIHPLLYPALFLQSFALGILTPIITLYVISQLGLTPAYFNGLLIAGGGVTALGLIPAGRLIDRWGSRYFLNIGFLLAGTALIGIASTTVLAWIWIFVVCVGLSYAMILPAWNSLLANLVPAQERGMIWGLFLTLQGSGLVIGPLVSGKLWDIISPQAPFFVSASSMFILFGIHWIMIRHRKKLAVSKT